ncbi:MAG: tRNA (adenosine(37)-N6)-threonylcarbamoyltransferase complex ATPase subunit type 1 TsaE [Pseudorhodobacter sp.]|nr:MAG: tRNA (adenosine(37)-N6)-threonylcarbamoyltransferase complex ATPase subunit type 1 TsaE [Pseudorhodobacter sp.]
MTGANILPLSLYLADADATAALGQWFAPRLRAGDTLLLEGAIGAGKSHFARALIQTRLGRAEDVPSPTFTLVQTYQADVELWHADLYRLTHPDEVLELGLEAAFDSAICLIEWPDRLGRHTPTRALRLHFSLEGDGRQVGIDLDGRADLAAALEADFGRK